ncbi:peptidoglycan-binding protein [Actinomadura barringtoniae]|uniref:Peptidoglycan-binding protein n=1 Tax=Actinomadura barringtoniae TaxID=1427535 RepID=A0A939PN42_9ACTN|nr:peptidoglycan-binding protein [Actinomadura barringtoniae]
MRRVFDALGSVARVVVGAEELPAADPVVVREILVGLGYVVPMDEVNGVLREFQANVGLKADGVAGPQTVRALSEARAAVRVARAAMPRERRQAAGVRG